jgi:hypothetical protein
MNKYWENLNPRERNLLLITAAVVSIAVLGYSGIQGKNRIARLDGQISTLEQDVLSLNQLLLQKDIVDNTFKTVVSEHSTNSSVEEIHDSLRREIFRLALARPEIPALEQPVNPNLKYLVQIPRLQEGQLKEEGEGYREYQISLRIPAGTLLNVLMFMRRLEESSMLLSIDSFEITRHPSKVMVSVSLEVTRTVLDNPEEVIL